MSDRDIDGLPSHTGRERMMQAGELVGVIDDALAKLDALQRRVWDHPRATMYDAVRGPLSAARDAANTALRDMAWDLCGGNRAR